MTSATASSKEQASQAMNDIVTQAAEWLVKLSAEEPKATDEDYIAFEHWKNADQRHQKAVSKMEGMVGQLEGLSAESTHAALNSSKKKGNESWASLAKVLSVMVFVLLPLAMLLPQQQVAGLLADKHTSTGEWQSYTLADNSRITLNSNSAVNIDFNQQQRTVELLHGEILVDVAHDATRPFVVHTKYGDLTALGTRFVVQRKENSTVLTVLESKVSAETAYDAALNTKLIVSPGQQLTLYDDHISTIETIDAAGYEEAWQSHQLVVQGMPLSEVLKALSRFHPAHLQYDADELASLRVSAVLPLDEPARALQLLSESFPIQVQAYTPLWVSIDKADAE